MKANADNFNKLFFQSLNSLFPDIEVDRYQANVRVVKAADVKRELKDAEKIRGESMATAALEYAQRMRKTMPFNGEYITEAQTANFIKYGTLP